MLSSLNKLVSKFSKGWLRETRKYLESFYSQQPNQPQNNNVREDGEEGEAMHTHENYWNHPYQLPALMPYQQ